MRRCAALITAAMVAAFWTGGAAASQKTALPSPYKKWLDEDVVYIITAREREVFLKLQTDRDRDLFIGAFWKHRDPTPGTPENEFRTEHYRRIGYANRYFGRSAPVPGWRTDRGRIYIILGEPNDIQKFEGKTGVYPSEIWFYQNKESLGLPVGFNLVFFQEAGIGDYKLYSPAKDGPRALMTTYYGDPVDYTKAYQALRQIEPALADVSLSLISGDRGSGLVRPSLASDLLLQKVEAVPRTQVEDRYAQKFLQFKDLVEVEYSANYLDSDSLVKVFKEPGGLAFVHYAVELRKLSVNAFGNTYSATLKINGTVSALDGKMIYQFERPVSLSLDEARMKEASRMPFDLHDMFPLIPGTYKLSILVKNEISKEFTSLENTLLVPGEQPALQIMSPLLGYRTAAADGAQKRLKPFQIGSAQIYCQPNRVFTRNDTLTVAFQVFGLTAEQRRSGEIRLQFFRDGQSAFERCRPIAEYAEYPNILELVVLAEIPSAHYSLKISVLAGGRELLAAAEEFDVTHQEAVPRPWFYSKIVPGSSDPLYAQLVGSQLFNAGRFEEAKRYLERALKEKPDSIAAALALARAYGALSEFAKIPGILSRFLEQTQTPDYETLWLAGLAYQRLGDPARSVEIFERALSHFGVNINILNAIGDGYALMGKSRDAAASWEKSLAIDPRQPEVRKKAEAVKEKK